MCATILSIETAGPTLKARRLVFDDGTQPRLTSAAVVRQLGLQAGAATTPALLEDALAQAEPALAKQKAIELLSFRERSVAELERGLRDCGYHPDLARSVTARMAELGLVDDERFAGMWARSRVAAGLGPRRIEQELASKGVSVETARQAIETECAADDQLPRARAALRGARPQDRKERDKLVRRLVTRGFSLSVALEAVDSMSLGDEELNER